MNEIFILLILFQLKHFIADFILQVPYMYLNKGKSHGWFWPLLDHASIHGMFTVLIILGYFTIKEVETSLYITFLFISLSLLDIISHFIIDRWKATRKSTPDQNKFWIYLGIDQMLHHLISILIIYLLII